MVAALAVIFVFQNRERHQIDFLFFEFSTRTWTGLATAFVLGVVCDRLFSSWWRRSSARRVRALTGRFTMRRVESSDGVSVVVHDLGGRGPALLISHATGFHAHTYLPMAEALADRFHTFTLDFRGHGDTPAPPGWVVDWRRYGDDTSAVADTIAPEGGLIGFGHSMGGSALLMAAERDPSLFDLIVAFEPIGSPPLAPVDDGVPHVLLTTMVEAARRRRRSFSSYTDTIDNYRSKPPMAAFTPEALRNYVEHGFAPSADGVTLRCDPELEAQTFLNGRENGVWNLLPAITTAWCW